jgi:exosortase K
MLTFVIVVGFGLKLAYSRLGADQFAWMTGPTQALVGYLAGIDFTYESGYGFVNFPRKLVIAKSCAGVNYLLAVFGMLSFTLIPRVAGLRRKVLAVCALAGFAYATTILVNSIRIALGIVLHDAGAHWGWLNPERIHRVAGIVVYFAALVAVHRLTRGALAGSCAHDRDPILIVKAPLFWYGLIALVVPFLNGAFVVRPGLFAEHCAWVLLVALLLAAILGKSVKSSRIRPACSSARRSASPGVLAVKTRQSNSSSIALLAFNTDSSSSTRSTVSS